MYLHVKRWRLNDQTITLTCSHLYCVILMADNGVLCHVYVRWIDKSHHYHKALQSLCCTFSGGSYFVVRFSSALQLIYCSVEVTNAHRYWNGIKLRTPLAEKQAKPSSLGELALYYCVIRIIITISTQDNHTSLVMFDINGGNINTSPPVFQMARQENT